ncbi:hypothetical protein [Nocardioides sp. B-3]|uniref:hypothetical protein n=1 Tax=Nocardioides sp. B-3 TaxID=2895565 RepID=UPI0021530BE6|nr:hypothetical protein [Nocardioides sp. B-3]UUZ61309.1 hypothetical protein LP418_12390 [Nocardioides sp. B-3]
MAPRLVSAAENARAAGPAPRAIALLDELAPTHLAPDPAMSALELRASIAIRSGSVRHAAALLGRAAAETGSPDARAVLPGRGAARDALPRRRRGRWSAGRRADLGGVRRDDDAVPRDRHRGARDGQGPRRSRRHRGAPRRRTPPRRGRSCSRTTAGCPG